MPFLRSSTRPQAVECFFCLSPGLCAPETVDTTRKGKAPAGQPGSRWNWHCTKCGCWNIRDSRGEMISDLPAMHNSALNDKSFSLRATPSKSRLPVASSSTSPFCRSCLANQTLIMNMLANYLPDDDDPSFESLYAGLPDYLSNFHLRYPPVCPSCQPAVDEVLKKSDQKARGEVWTRALKRGAQRSQEGLLSGPNVFRVWCWRTCGGLYGLGVLGSLGMGIASAIQPGRVEFLGLEQRHGLCVLGALIASATALAGLYWDPYWRKRARLGEQAKVRGMNVWRRNNALILASRLLPWVPISGVGIHKRFITASVLEAALLLHSLLNLRISQPVSLRLVRPVSLSSPSTPIRPEYSSQVPDPLPFTSLSLDHDPLRYANPIFGQPSLQNQPHPTAAPVEAEPMDWEPAPSAPISNGHWPSRPLDWDPEDEEMITTPKKSDWDRFAVQKQRLFPREGNEETGLESLLAGWGIGNQPQNGIHVEPAKTVRTTSDGQVVISINPRMIASSALCSLGIIRLYFAFRMFAASEGASAIDESAALRFNTSGGMICAELLCGMIMFVTTIHSTGSKWSEKGLLLASLCAFRAVIVAITTITKDKIMTHRWTMPGLWMIWATMDFVSCLC